ncbi:MAG: hypothetical protein CMI54_02015 [Parcubacteria group bacterium]|nr:hypothetical protein [Parcubacteria group bacterium]|tara:strand:- start:1196 stop:1570 length:375 start_codon:yes stop_codon:yes gene_type:complete
MADKIIYKNHCTPQEQVSVNGRYYLDGDCGRKLTGSAVISGLTTSAPVIITGNTAIGTGKDFLSIKVISGDDILISFDGSGGGAKDVLILSEGECLAVKLNPSVDPDIYVTISGTSTVEYFTGT